MRNRTPGPNSELLMRSLFDLIFFFVGLIFLPSFFRRLKQVDDPGRLLRERLGFFKKAWLARFETKQVIWIHAVSVGEVQAVGRLAKSLEDLDRGFEILVSTVTPTGQDTARSIVRDHDNVFYFPFDWARITDRVVRKLKPRLVLLTETEIWPNLIVSLEKAGVPIGIVNGRLSEKSFQGYRRIGWVTKRILPKISFFLMRSGEDERRMAELGAPPERIQITGNMKFDVVNAEEFSRGELLHQWGFQEKDRILIGGSTHPGEEEALLRVLTRLRFRWPSLKLVLAPRHIERGVEVFRTVERLGFQGCLASQAQGDPNARFDVLILDLLGFLRKLYAIGELVFMGGSLIPHGGQNPLEPAIYKKPILFGPHTFNFGDIYARIAEEEAGVEVGSEEELAKHISLLLSNPARQKLLGTRIYHLVMSSRGATERNVKFVQNFLRVTESAPVPFWGFPLKDQLRRYFIALAEDPRKGGLTEALRSSLRFASHFYGAAVKARNGLYERGILKSYRLPFPVVSVGNMTWGGTGKTPLVEFLLEKVKTRQKKALLLSRGYGEDELRQIQAHFPELRLALGPRREHLALSLAQEERFDIGICDDGFQHRSLDRNWEIVVVDALNPFGNGFLLPRGILREPLPSLCRAETILLTHCDLIPRAECDALEAKVRNVSGAREIFKAVHKPVSFWRASTQETIELSYLRGRSAVAFCAIGSPESFRRTLQGLGIRIRDWVIFEDHRFLSAKEIEQMVSRKRAACAEVLITTEKDYFRQPRVLASALDPYILKVKLKFLSGENEMEAHLANLLHAEFQGVSIGA